MSLLIRVVCALEKVNAYLALQFLSKDALSDRKECFALLHVIKNNWKILKCIWSKVMTFYPILFKTICNVPLEALKWTFGDLGFGHPHSLVKY